MRDPNCSISRQTLWNSSRKDKSLQNTASTSASTPDLTKEDINPSVEEDVNDNLSVEEDINLLTDCSDQLHSSDEEDGIIMSNADSSTSSDEENDSDPDLLYGSSSHDSDNDEELDMSNGGNNPFDMSSNEEDGSGYDCLTVDGNSMVGNSDQVDSFNASIGTQDSAKVVSGMKYIMNNRKL